MKLLYSTIFAALAICFILFPDSLAASEAPADTAAYTLQPGEVVVRARRTYADVIPAQHLDGARLRGLNSQSVADAIRYFSGVQVKDYGGVGGIKTIDVRSMGSSHVGVFYDGIQLGNAQNGQIDLGRYSLDNVKSISIYNGQRSEIFQPARDFGTASAVYIATQPPAFSSDSRPVNVTATMRTGSFGLANPSLRVDYRLCPAVSATVGAEYTYATGRYKFRYRKFLPDGSVAWDTTATRRNGDINALRIEGALYGSIPRGSWQAKAYYYHSQRGIPGAIVNNVWKNSQRQWDRNLMLQGRWVKRLSSRYSLMLNAKYARDYMRYLNPDTTLMYIDNTFIQHEAYLSAANRFNILPNFDINISADWQFNALQSSMVNFAHPRRNSLQGALAVAWRPGPFKCQGSLLLTEVLDRYTVTNSTSLSTRRSASTARLTPALFISWVPMRAHSLNLRAFVKQTFRMPTFNDLYYTDLGNANLRPERATQWNIGTTWHTEIPMGITTGIDLTADAYYNLVNDKIIAVPKGTGQYRWMMMNIGRVKIHGFDATANFNTSLAHGITLNCHLTYTFQMARDYSDPSDTHGDAASWGRQIAYIPRHSGSVTAAAYWRRAEINYSFIYVGERWQNSSNIPVNYIQPWYTHDLSASWRQPLGHSSLRITLEVNNLLNQQYEVIANYPMPGRNYKIILTFNL